MVGVGFEDGSFLNSPSRGALGLSFPTPRGALCLSCPPRGAPGLSFPTTGGLRASISPPHSECQMDSTQSRSRLHPAAPIGSCKRTGGAASHPPAPPGAVMGQRGTRGHPTHEQL